METYAVKMTMVNNVVRSSPACLIFT
jgi:hypothetical protein